MPVAVSLQDAADIALSNVQFQRDGGVTDLRAAADSFVAAFVVLFNDESAPERTVLNWAVPFQLVNQTVPAGVVNQTQVNSFDLGTVLFRTMNAAADAEAAGRITPLIAGFLLALYNATWA